MTISPLNVHIVDPSAYAPPYDHELCSALARAGADVELHTSRFAYGPVPEDAGYRTYRTFYRFQPGNGNDRARRFAKLAQHGPDMLAYRRRARRPDVVHLQWLPLEPVDVTLLPRRTPVVFTAHEVLPRAGSRAALLARRRLYERVDAVIVHTEHGRRRLTEELGVDPAKVELIPHGAFQYLAEQPEQRPLPPDLAAVEGPVVLSLGVWRPYHGLDVLLDAWRGIEGAELWLAGLPRMPLDDLRRSAPPGVRFIPRFITDPELPAFFRRADLCVFPYRSIEASGSLFSALPFGRPILASAVGGFLDAARDGAAAVAPCEPAGMHDALVRLLGDADERERLAAGARAAAEGVYSWDRIAQQTLAVYERVAQRALGRSA